MREKLIEVMKDTRANATWHRWGYEESADYLNENDVVPVVRCNDCRYYNPDGEYCGFWGGARHPEHYCGEGDRESNE